MYYPDLSPYKYFGNNEYELLGTLNVGWLDKEHSYSKGPVDDRILSRLFRFCLSPVHTTRGFHKCQFCDPRPSFLIEAQQGKNKVWLGNAEIRIVYRDQVYAAPDLVYHYIAQHNYRPPDEFLEATLKGPLPGSSRYEEMREKYWD